MYWIFKDGEYQIFVPDQSHCLVGRTVAATSKGILRHIFVRVSGVEIDVL